MNRCGLEGFKEARIQDRRIPGTIVKFLPWVLLIIVVILVRPLFAEDNPAVTNNIGTIRITADSLTVPGGSENHAEFSGHVHAIGDRFAITADHLKIFYRQPSTGAANSLANGNSLTKIIATGNVVISSGEKIAKTEEAVYDKEQQTIILSGEHSTVLQNNSYISGERIVLHTGSEAITVESGDGKRVEAFIEAQDINND